MSYLSRLEGNFLLDNGVLTASFGCRLNVLFLFVGYLSRRMRRIEGRIIVSFLVLCVSVAFWFNFNQLMCINNLNFISFHAAIQVVII